MDGCVDILVGVDSLVFINTPTLKDLYSQYKVVKSCLTGSSMLCEMAPMKQGVHMDTVFDILPIEVVPFMQITGQLDTGRALFLLDIIDLALKINW